MEETTNQISYFSKVLAFGPLKNHEKRVGFRTYKFMGHTPLKMKETWVPMVAGAQPSHCCDHIS